MQKYTLKVQEVVNETGDTITIRFKQPGLKKVKYKPGQYLTICVNVNGRKYKRPYSISSAPGIDSTVDVTVKRVAGGVVSNFLNDTIAEGQMMEVLEPIGDFVLSENQSSANLVLWGAGSGVTPLLSILKASLINSIGHISLVYCNRDHDSVIFKKMLDAIVEQNPDRLKVYYIYSKPKREDHNIFQTGRLNKQMVHKIIEEISDPINTLHYICGPKGIKETVVNELISLSFPENQIYFENFEKTIDPKEFEGVEDREISIDFNGTNSMLRVEKGKSFLDAALDSGFDLPYSCQIGTCLECKGKIISGDVRMLGLEKVPSELMTDECLLCCSHPLTDNIQIQIN
ncbi:ferredoxin--NADP reductase [Solitalea koreensis]|uniref:Ring-1,2-phenylacetyl-CoA epoxidase subunit PaaE n=1 Tax=Solitalea koreensis TaxID=543615 RepID=A0A521CPD3_9SPHI|nr:ferredoxin--NADP reductase [Solitalea koreensis]SMO61286.1 ring-1,2-phenylacetyl-CoA epoxidase subunit PaaE [Solitalea koreensis]